MAPYFSIPGAFFVIAFVFSMLGMGGSQVYIPILFWAGLDFKTEAIPLGMLLNVVNTASAAAVYAARKFVAWRTALPFAVAMVVFPPLGAWVNLKLRTDYVVVVFALFTAAAAVLMLSGWRPRRRPESFGGRAALGLAGGGTLGFFAGLIGRGGGSFVVPLLYIAGLEAKAAAATSAFVVSFSGTSSFLSHLATAARPDWPLWGLCVGAVFAGSQIGSRLMARRIPARVVRRVFAVVLLAISATLIIKDVWLD
jgi:uncharacterized membrane protein YfcA